MKIIKKEKRNYVFLKKKYKNIYFGRKLEKISIIHLEKKTGRNGEKGKERKRKNKEETGRKRERRRKEKIHKTKNKRRRTTSAVFKVFLCERTTLQIFG